MNKGPQKTKQLYYLPSQNSQIITMTQPTSSKNNSLSISIGGHQTASSFLHMNRTKSEIVDCASNDVSHNGDGFNKHECELQTISKQNMFLREQNQQLKQQLQRLRNRIPDNPHSKKYSVSPSANNDLRGTIKKEKQMGEMKQMRRKLQMLSKQCKMYEEIIEKMEERIKKLTLQNSKNTAQIDDLHGQLAKFQHLKEKCNGLMSLYSEMESKFNSDQLEWIKWKQSWLSEKEHYLIRIQQLQKLAKR